MKGNNNEQDVYVNVKKNGIYFLEHFKIPENSSVENWLLDNHPEYEFIDCGDYEDMLWQVRMGNLGCRRMLSADGKCDDTRYVAKGITKCWHCDIMKTMNKKYGKEA